MRPKNILLLAFIPLLLACQRDEAKIKRSAYGYIHALGNYQPTEARPYATPETCDTTLAFMEMLVAHTDPAVYADNIPAEITIGKIEIHDTTAEAAYHKSTPSVEQDGTVHLVKREGQWRVHQIVHIPNLPFPGKSPRTFTKSELQQMKRHEGGQMKLPMESDTSE